VWDLTNNDFVKFEIENGHTLRFFVGFKNMVKQKIKKK